MSNSIQCHQPLAVGASGSKQVTAKLRVCAGKPLQRRCGETFPPPIPSYTWVFASHSPSVMSLLSTVNDGTGGRESYGDGALILTSRNRWVPGAPYRSAAAPVPPVP